MRDMNEAEQDAYDNLILGIANEAGMSKSYLKNQIVEERDALFAVIRATERMRMLDEIEAPKEAALNTCWFALREALSAAEEAVEAAMREFAHAEDTHIVSLYVAEAEGPDHA